MMLNISSRHYYIIKAVISLIEAHLLWPIKLKNYARSATINISLNAFLCSQQTQDFKTLTINF